MDIVLDTKSGIPIHLQVSAQIKLLIVGGVLRAGDQLPSVRELAVRLRINPNTVSRTYRDLQQEGIVESRRGEGNYVSEKTKEIISKEKERLIMDSFREAIEKARTFGYGDEETRKFFNESMRQRRHR